MNRLFDYFKYYILIGYNNTPKLILFRDIGMILCIHDLTIILISHDCLIYHMDGLLLLSVYSSF